MQVHWLQYRSGVNVEKMFQKKVCDYKNIAAAELKFLRRCRYNIAVLIQKQ